LWTCGENFVNLIGLEVGKLDYIACKLQRYIIAREVYKAQQISNMYLTLIKKNVLVRERLDIWIHVTYGKDRLVYELQNSLTYKISFNKVCINL